MVDDDHGDESWLVLHDWCLTMMVIMNIRTGMKGDSENNYENDWRLRIHDGRLMLVGNADFDGNDDDKGD